MLLNCGVGEDSSESLGLQGDQTSPSWRIPRTFTARTDSEAETPNTLATWWEEPTHWKRSWCSERLKAEGEGDDIGRDGWMALLTQPIWVWASSGKWWMTGKPGMLQSMGSQGCTRLSNWTGLISKFLVSGPLSSLNKIGKEAKEIFLNYGFYLLIFFFFFCITK